MLVSPAERPPLNSLGKVSSLPEQYGADYLIFSPLFGTVGVQRKEINDLVASLSDDRIAREVTDMKGLDVGIWLIEGNPNWSGDGQLLSSRTPFTRQSFQGITLSLMSQGFWMAFTDSIQDTMNWLLNCEKWMMKLKHNSLNQRPKARGVFGVADLTEQRIHFMQGFPGLGYDRAAAIVSHFQGLPVQLKEGVILENVPGIGKGTAKKIREVLGE